MAAAPGGDLIEALDPFVIYFHSGNAAVDRASNALARSFGIHYVVEGDTPGSTYGAGSQAGIPGLLAEAGGQRASGRRRRPACSIPACCASWRTWV